MTEIPLYHESLESSCRSSPVFLIGSQRSGTTALAFALSKAFRAAGGCFTVNGKLPYFLKRWWTQDNLDCQHLRADEVEHGLRRAPAGGANIDTWSDRASAALRAGAVRSAKMEASPSVTEEVRLICEEAYGTSLWGDKYNEYLLDLPWLGHIFPTARWIFIVREPADVIASMLAWSQEKVWNPRDVRAAAAKWATWNECWLRFRESLEPARVFEMGYQQLADDGGVRLSGWLGMDVATHLSGFTAQRRCVRVELTPEALGVRRSLARLGLLAGEQRVPGPRHGRPAGMSA